MKLMIWGQTLRIKCEDSTPGVYMNNS